MEQPTEIEEAWLSGQQLQYFQVLGYDSEWTDYTRTERPDFSDERWLWRIKPAA